MNFHPVQKTIEVIRQAWLDGRRIVPLVGTGFSAEAGVPTIEGVIHYLAELRSYVDGKAYLPGLHAGDGEHSPGLGLFDSIADAYPNVSDYVREHGWPNYYHHYQNFGSWIRGRRHLGSLSHEVSRQLDDLARLLYPNPAAELRELLNDADQPPEDRLVPQSVNSMLWKFLGRWPDLLLHVTGGDASYTTNLFERMQQDHRPGSSHRFLAFLTRVLGIRLFLSTAFDALLETALTDEGIEHSVFVMEEGRRMPPPELIRAVTAVLRFDGDLRNLAEAPMYSPLSKGSRDELGRCLPPDALLLVMGTSGGDRRILDLVEVAADPKRSKSPAVIWLHHEPLPPRSITQLPGLEDDRIDFVRVTHAGLFLSHLYSALTSRHPSSRVPYLAHPQRPIGLEPRHTVPERDAENSEGVRLSHNGSCFLFSSLPRPGKPARPATAPNATERLAAFVNDLRSHIPVWIDLESQHTLAGVVGAIIDQCRTFDPALAPATLPLGDDERQQAAEQGGPPGHTGAIERRASRHQPDHTDQRQVSGHAGAIERGASRVVGALSRARYLLAVDALECYTWPHTAHHGDTKDREAREKLRNPLIRFLESLIEQARSLNGSLIAISIGQPEIRRLELAPPIDDRELDKIEDELQKTEANLKLAIGSGEDLVYRDPDRGPERTLELSGAGDKLEHVLLDPNTSRAGPPSGENPRWRSPETGPRLALLCLSCFRRTRNLVALHTILNQLVNDPLAVPKDPYREIDVILRWFQDTEYLLPVAGGGYWMNRLLRDQVYSINSQYTSKSHILELVKTLVGGNKLEPAHLIRTVLQCLLLSFHHDRIGHYYYFHNYTQSQDSFAFFEYVYHCVSSIRYLTQLVLLRAIVTKYDTAAWKKAGEACQGEFRLERIPRGYLNVTDKELESLLDPKLDPGDLQHRRRREIRGLRLSWRRSREALLRTVPAEQMISSCHALIDDDLPRILVQGYSSAIARLDQDLPGGVDDMDTPTRVRDEVESLEADLLDLEAQSYRNRADYDECILLRLRQQLRRSRERGWGSEAFQGKGVDLVKAFKEYAEILFACARDVLDHLLPVDLSEVKLKKREKKQFRQACGWWLDIAECLVAMDEQDALTGKVDNSPRTEELLEGLRERLPLRHDPRNPQVHKGAGPRLRFRCQLLWAQHRFGRVKFWRSHDLPKEKADHAEWPGQETYNLCREALIELRQYDLAGGRAYFELRSRFLILRAKARPLCSSAHSFVEAYRDLELARGGERHVDYHTRALADSFGAQFALIEADEILTLAARSPGGGGEAGAAFPPLAKAAAKLALARGYLRRVPAQLAAGPRNTVWWKFFFVMVARYYSEKNLWTLVMIVSKRFSDRSTWPPEGESSSSRGVDVRLKSVEFLRRLQLGLRAIRRGVDRDLNRDPDKLDPRLQQTWRELFFGSILFVLEFELPWREAGANPPRDLVPEGLLAAWWSLNHSAGLIFEESRDEAEWGKNQLTLVRKWSPEILSLREGAREGAPPLIGLRLRSRILEAADSRLELAFALPMAVDPERAGSQ